MSNTVKVRDSSASVPGNYESDKGIVDPNNCTVELKHGTDRAVVNTIGGLSILDCSKLHITKIANGKKAVPAGVTILDSKNAALFSAT